MRLERGPRRNGVAPALLTATLAVLVFGSMGTVPPIAAGAAPDTSVGVVALQVEQAADHVGETATVCGRVESSAHIASVKGQPTFLNLGKPYPDQLFTVVIWGATRSQFDGPPERLFDGKEICVSGTIARYQGKPQIVVDDASQITVVDPAFTGVALTETERMLVKALLASLGYEVNYGSGEWDEETVASTAAFQRSVGVEPSGEPDADTLRALAGAVTEIPDADRDLVIRLLLFQMAARWE
jgi:hypothetical protein